jgi:hypothetical protein
MRNILWPESPKSGSRCYIVITQGRTTVSNLILSGYMAKQGWPKRVMRNRHAEVARLEARYGVVLPEDFREYLLTLCPDDDQWDDDLGIWWGLGSIKSISEDYKQKVAAPEIEARSSQYLLFADHCIWCWAWAIACTDDKNRGMVALIGSPDRFVAPSFTSFAEAYVTDWASVN